MPERKTVVVKVQVRAVVPVAGDDVEGQREAYGALVEQFDELARQLDEPRGVRKRDTSVGCDRRWDARLQLERLKGYEGAPVETRLGVSVARVEVDAEGGNSVVTFEFAVPKALEERSCRASLMQALNVASLQAWQALDRERSLRRTVEDDLTRAQEDRRRTREAATARGRRLGAEGELLGKVVEREKAVASAAAERTEPDRKMEKEMRHEEPTFITGLGPKPPATPRDVDEARGRQERTTQPAPFVNLFEEAAQAEAAKKRAAKAEPAIEKPQMSVEVASAVLEFLERKGKGRLDMERPGAVAALRIINDAAVWGGVDEVRRLAEGRLAQSREEEGRAEQFERRTAQLIANWFKGGRPREVSGEISPASVQKANALLADAFKKGELHVLEQKASDVLVDAQMQKVLGDFAAEQKAADVLRAAERKGELEVLAKTVEAPEQTQRGGAQKASEPSGFDAPVDPEKVRRRVPTEVEVDGKVMRVTKRVAPKSLKNSRDVEGMRAVLNAAADRKPAAAAKRASSEKKPAEKKRSSQERKNAQRVADRFRRGRGDGKGRDSR